MSPSPDLERIRREYGDLRLSKQTIKSNPIEQFNLWFEEVLDVEISDPTAMVLATVDEDGRPDARVVLLKGIMDNAFIFYTNYLSAKGKQLMHMPEAALNFYWPELVRQVRARGLVKKLDPEISDAYFQSRPRLSQISAIASKQSEVVDSRGVLEANIEKCRKELEGSALTCPEYWGGYELIPNEFEFWQGRDNRLHDRIRYFKEKDGWDNQRLFP